MTAAKKTKTKTKTTDTVEMQRDSFDRLAKLMEGMRRVFVQDSITLKPHAMRDRWATMDWTEVAVLLIAGGKGKGKDRNPKFEVGGVFATASLAEEKARDLGIDGEDIVRSWDDGIGGDMFAIVYDAKTKQLYGLNASGWAPRAMTPDYLRGALPADRLFYDQITARMTFFEMSDDRMVAPAAAARLRAWYPRAAVRRRLVEPAALGLRSVGHFG